jgi:hypothetical protein
LAEKWIELAQQNAAVDCASATLLRTAALLIDDQAVTRRDLAKGGTVLYSGAGRRYLHPLIKHLRQVESELIVILKALQVEPEEV